MDPGVTLAIASFFGAILGAVFSNLLSAGLAYFERREARRREKLKSLSDVSDKLVKIYGTFEKQIPGLNAGVPMRMEDIQEARGMAKALMLSVDDEQLRQIALNKIQLDTIKTPDWLEQFRQAFVEGMTRLGELIEAASK